MNAEDPARGPQARPTDLARTPLFPRRLAFVVQFSRDSSANAAPFCGRVEHIASARAARFDDRDALLAFVSRVLDEEQGAGRAPPARRRRHRGDGERS